MPEPLVEAPISLHFPTTATFGSRSVSKLVRILEMSGSVGVSVGGSFHSYYLRLSSGLVSWRPQVGMESKVDGFDSLQFILCHALVSGNGGTIPVSLLSTRVAGLEKRDLVGFLVETVPESCVLGPEHPKDTNGTVCSLSLWKCQSSRRDSIRSCKLVTCSAVCLAKSKLFCFCLIISSERSAAKSTWNVFPKLPYEFLMRPVQYTL